MKILFIAPRFHPNQAGWADTLLKHGHEVKYITSTKNPIPEVFARNIVYLKNSGLSKVLLSILKKPPFKYLHIRQICITFPPFKTLKESIRDFRPDVVIIRDAQSVFSIQSSIIAKSLGIKSVLYRQKRITDKIKGIDRILTTLTPLPKVWITPIDPSHGHGSQIHSKAHYVPIVLYSIKDRDPSLKNKEGDLVKILFVGKFTLKRKNHLLLLEVIKELLDNYNISLTMIGGLVRLEQSVLKEVEKYIRENNLTDRVQILLNIPSEEMFGYYKAHDIFVLPSSNEPFGYSTLEAMYCGLPVIVSDSGGTRYCISNGDEGYIFLSDNAEDLQQSLEKLVSSKKLRDRMGIKVQRHIDTEHSPDRFYSCFMRMIESVN